MFDKQTKQLLSYNLPLTEDCFNKHSGLIATQNLGLYSRTYANLGVINPLIVSSFHLGDSVIKAGTKSAVKGNKWLLIHNYAVLHDYTFWIIVMAFILDYYHYGN